MRALGPCGTAMTPEEPCQIDTTTTPLTSGVPTIHMAHSPMWSTRAMDVNVLTMGWNCRKVCIATIQWTRQASMRMPATSKSTVPAVQHGIRCLVLHGLNTALLRRIGATRCTIGASCLGASWEVAAQRELQLRCLQGRRRHSSATTRVCQRRIAAPPLMTYGVRLTGMTTTGLHRRNVQIAGLTCVNVFSRGPTCQARCTSTTLEISQVNSPAFLTLQHMGPAVLHGTLCPAHLCLLAAGRTQTGPARHTIFVSCLGATSTALVHPIV